MPLTAPSHEWIAEAMRLIRLSQPVKCWRCAVTVEASVILVPGRCTPSLQADTPDTCPLNVVARDLLGVGA